MIVIVFIRTSGLFHIRNMKMRSHGSVKYGRGKVSIITPLPAPIAMHQCTLPLAAFTRENVIRKYKRLHKNDCKQQTKSFHKPKVLKMKRQLYPFLTDKPSNVSASVSNITFYFMISK